MKKRLLSLVLCLVMVFSLFPAFGMSAAAADPDPTEGIHLNKTYDPATQMLTLESYVEGGVSIIHTETAVPCDIVMVLDVSGSMEDPMTNSQVVGYFKYHLLTSNEYDFSRLDKTKPSGYYAATRDGFFTGESTMPVRYSGGNWQYYYNNRWTNITNSTGEVYIYRSKLGAMMDAANTFIDRVHADSVDNNVEHKISIVTFASSASTNAQLTSAVSNSNVTSLKNVINSLSANGATQANYGMRNAVNELNSNRARADAKKAVILFTDGEPTSGSHFEESVANSAVNYSHQLKSNGASVYAVGSFNSFEGFTDPDTWQTYSAAQVEAMVKNYMNAVSSNYPDATTYNVNDTRIRENFMIADDEDELNAIFTKIAEDVISGGASVELDEQTVIKDVMSNKFQLSGVTAASHDDIKVYTAPCTGKDDEGFQFGDKSPVASDSGIEVSVDEDTQTVEVTGFNYAENWCGYNASTGRYQGQKLIIEIPVEPAAGASGDVFTNDESSGIYVDGETVKPFPVPTATIPTVTNIIDFNAQMRLATSADTAKFKVAEDENGEFDVSGTDLVYQLSTEAQGNKIAAINGQYSGIDVATAWGIPVGSAAGTAAAWVTYNVIPGSNVYYSDALVNTTVDVGDGSGYNEDIDGEISKSAVRMDSDTATSALFFTFYGTGIDIYCTTHADAGYVNAAVFKADNKDGCTSANRIADTVTVMKNYSAENRYNVPTLHFDLSDQAAQTYTVRINAVKGSQYKLDGVRVYNAVDEDLLTGTDEADASYLNLHELLLNAENGFSVENKIPEIPDDDADIKVVNGVLFVDDAENLSSTWMEDGVEVPKYATNFDAYKAVGPKNEIYLAKGQAITFMLNTSRFDEDTKLWVGLSAPQDGTGKVMINSNSVATDVTSYIDMYYPVTVPSSGSVTITNSEDALIAVTDLKITNMAEGAKLTTSSARDFLFAPMNARAIVLAANNGVDPEAVVAEDPIVEPDPEPTADPEPVVEPEPEPTTPSVHSIIQQLFSSFVNSLFGSMSRLFGR